MIEIAVPGTIKAVVFSALLYLLELENIELTSFDKNRILIYSK